VSILSIFYAKLLFVQITNAEKTDDLTVFFAISVSECVKEARKMLMKLTPGVTSHH